MNWDKETEKNTITLKLTGDLTIEHMSELKEILVQVFTEDKNIVINLCEAHNIDLSFLQLFCAAHRTALKRNKSLKLDRKWSESCTQVIEQSGFARHTGCSFDKDQSCMWVKEEDNG